MAAGFAGGVALAQSAPGGGYPSRPVRYVVGGTVGGGADSLARAIAQKLGDQWGQQVIVDNRPGAGSNIGIGLAALIAYGGGLPMPFLVCLMSVVVLCKPGPPQPLAKGVIDGVVAPADTIKSLHFSEVAHHFTALRFSRGAYPARAMSDKTWQRLPADLQQLLNSAKPVWETALARDLVQADKAGADYAKGHGVEMIAFPEAEQAKLDALHDVALNGFFHA